MRDLTFQPLWETDDCDVTDLDLKEMSAPFATGINV